MTYSNDLKIKIIGVIKSRKFTNIEIMKIFGINKKTFYKIKNDSKLRGGSKYSHLKSYKRKSKITNSIKNFIIKYVTDKINFNYKKLLCIINKKYNLFISKTSIYRILKNYGVTKKKICNKQILTNFEKRKKQIKLFKEQINDILETSSMSNIISIDETSIDSHITNNYGWSKKGERIENVVKHSRIRYSLILAISCKKIIHKQIIKGSANGDTFLKFIKDLIKKLSVKKKSYVLLANARIHHNKKIKEFIITKPKIEFIYNIPYTPETNPIERVFNDLKRDLRNKKIDNFNLVSEIKNSLININRNNNFQKYFEKSLIYEINKL